MERCNNLIKLPGHADESGVLKSTITAITFTVNILT